MDRFLHADVVLVPVPLAVLPAVIRARDEALGADPSPAARDAVEVAEPLGNAGWDGQMLRTFADKLNYPLVISLFDACAMRPASWIPKAQIDGDGDPRQLRNELGAMSKLIKKHFGAGTDWPIEWRKLRGQYDYRLDAETAAAWRQIRDLTEDRSTGGDR